MKVAEFFKNLSSAQLRVGLVIALNITIVIVESSVGVISGSLALLSDAWHNLSDVLALIITAIALSFGARGATARMTFGYVRSEMMATFINATFLMILMLWVGVEAINRLLHPVSVDGWLTMITAGIALIINTASALVLGGHSHSHKHHHEHNHEHSHEDERHKDLNVQAAFWHMASDAILSLAVVLGGGAMILWGVVWVDSVLSLLFVGVILFESVKLLKTSFLSLMDSADPLLLEKLSQILQNHPLVEEVHDLHLINPSSNECYFSAHIILDAKLHLNEVEEIIESLRHALTNAGATHILLQPETLKYSEQDTKHCNAH